MVCLQETHCSSDNECQVWFRSSDFCSSVSSGTARSRGCIILFRPSLSLVNLWRDTDGRYLLWEFTLQEKSFRVCCLYAPNRNPELDQFFDGISPKIDPAIPTVLAGDFNAVFDCSMDRSSTSSDDVSRESSVSLSRLFDACCVVDIWRYLHPASSLFTWTRWNGLAASRIDLVGAPYAWVPSVSSCTIIPCPFSDHCGVLLSLTVPDVTPPGPGLWKLNVSILDDDSYISLITDFWANWRLTQPNFSSLACWWDEGQRQIKNLTTRFCCSRSATNKQNRDLLVRLITHLKERVDRGFSSCIEPYLSALSDLAKFDSEKAKGGSSSC